MTLPSPIFLLRRVWRVLSMALSALWAYKLRSCFVIAAIALGIASLTVIIAALDGANRRADEITDRWGPDAVFILGRNIEKRAVGRSGMTLRWRDVRAITQSIPGVTLVVPMRGLRGHNAKYKNNNVSIGVIIATAENYGESWNWPLAEGRDITKEDMAKASRVTLLGDYIAQELFGDESPVGKSIFVNNVPFQVVGKLTPRGFTGGGGGNLDNRIIIPFSTAQKRFGASRELIAAIRVKFEHPEYMPAHVNNLETLLRKLHNIREGQSDDFSVLTSEDVQKFLSMIKGGLVVFLGVTAAAAILVGGFVLANLFYISVTERTAEIGLKKSLGAPNSAIMLQFLFEAIALAMFGAVVGMFLGLGMGQALEQLGLIEIRLSWKIFTISLMAAVAVGLVFGLRPARNAATMDPIQALRGGE